MAKASLPSFIASSKRLLQKESDLLSVRTSDGFNLNAYKQMKTSGYGFNKPPPLGNVIKAKPYRLNDTQNIIQRQGGGVVTLGIGLGCVPSPSVKISR